MRIQQLAQAVGVPVDTVRHYEKQGLLGAPARDANGYRRYRDSDLERLRFIRHCRELDMGLADVRELLDFLDHPRPDCSAADAVVANHLAQVRQRLAGLRVLEQQLVQLVAACRHPKPSERCGIVLALAAPDAPQGAEARGAAPAAPPRSTPRRGNAAPARTTT